MKNGRWMLLAGLAGIFIIVAAVMMWPEKGEEKHQENAAVPIAASAPAAPVQADGARDAAPAAVSEKKQAERTLDAAPEAPMPAEFARAMAGITGRVVEPDGRPVSGATVDLLSGFIEIMEFDFEKVLFAPESFRPRFTMSNTVTGADGRFHLKQVDPRAYYIIGVNLGKQRPQARFLDRALASSESLDLGDLALDPMLTLTGSVLDDGGRPVAGARVRATNLPSIAFKAGANRVEPGAAMMLNGRMAGFSRILEFPAWAEPLYDKIPLVSAQTDALGRFKIAGAPGGALTLLIDGTGIAPMVYGPVPASTNAEKDLGTITAARGEEIEVAAVDEADVPVPNAELRLGYPSEIESSLVFLSKPQTADASGKTSFKGVIAKQLVVLGRSDAVKAWTTSAPMDNDGERLKIKIPAARSVLVHVKDPSGAPMDAELAVQPSMRGPELFPPLVTRLAVKAERLEKGNYRIRGLSKGQFLVTASAAAFFGESADVSVDGAEEPVAEIQCAPARALRVRVSAKDDAGLRPLESATVMAILDSNRGRLGFRGVTSARTGADGVATIKTSSKPEDTKEVSVLASHPAFAPSMVHPDAGDAEVAVTLTAGGGAEIHVTAKGAAPKDAYMIVMSSHEMQEVPPRFALTDETGVARLAKLAPGEYRVEGVPRTFGKSLTQALESLGRMGGGFYNQITVKEGETARLDVDTEGGSGVRSGAGSASIHGTVRGAAKTDGLNVRVSGNEWRSARCEADGKFAFTGLVGGTYRVNLYQMREKGEVLAATATVTVGKTEDRFVDLEIRPGAAIAGRVLAEASGAPIAKARATLVIRTEIQKGNNYTEEVGEAETDAQGNYNFTDVAPGDYELAVTAPSYIRGHSEAFKAGEGGSVSVPDVKLAKGVLFSGRVEEPAPAKDLRGGISLSPKENNQGDWASVSFEPGTFAFKTEEIRPGTYYASIYMWSSKGGSAPRQRYAPLTVVVPAEGAQNVVLRFEAAPNGR